MFRRYPYMGWLLLSLLLWTTAGYYYYAQNRYSEPGEMTNTITADLRMRAAAFAQLEADTDLLNRMFRDSLTQEEVQDLGNLPCYVYAYEHNYLQFWNTNVILPSGIDSLNDKYRLVAYENGTYLVRKVKPPGYRYRTMVVMLPVYYRYPVENEYLHSHFAASSRIPATVRALPADSSVPGSYTVALADGQPVMTLSFTPADVQKWVPGTLFIILLAGAVLVSISWIHLMIIYFTRNRSSLAGFLSTLGIITIIRTLLFIWGPPFNMSSLLFFSPLLYASSSWLPSFGDLFIDTLCLLWLVIFVTRHTPYKHYFDNVPAGRLRGVLPAVLAATMVAYMLLFVGIVRSLVLDSSISFDVSQFYSIDIYTVLGLLVICAITGISCMIIYVFNYQLRQLQPERMRRYGTTLFMGIVVFLAADCYHEAFYWCTLAWLILFLVLLDVEKLKMVSDLFEPQMLAWALIIGAFATGIVQYFNIYKENEERKAFVEQRLAPHRDNVLEYDFDKTASTIEHDPRIKAFFTSPGNAARKMINRRFDSLYLASSSAARYDATVYFFSRDGRPLFNRDSATYASLIRQKTDAMHTGSPYLFYKESLPDRNAYLSYIPVYSDTINRQIGYVFIDLSLKKQAAETVYPELLMPPAGKNARQESEYRYATYLNGRLVSQSADYPFATYLTFDTSDGQDFRFIKENGTSQLQYRVSDKRTIVVVHEENSFIETITVFSYIFSIQVLLAVIILLYQVYLSYFAGTTVREKYMQLTLRRRIQYAMLSIVFISFLLIGIVTAWYFITRYESSNTTRLQTAMQTVRRSVQEYLTGAHAFDNDKRFDSVTQSVPFRKYITSLAANQKTDINLFDNNGNMFASSEEEIYQKGLISRIMRQDAYHQLARGGRSVVIQDEHVAGLSYLSAYEPMLDEQGSALGYLNVPFFSSEKELRVQLSNIMVTLMNVYAFIFLLSSLITVSITRWVTGSFNVIRDQFARLNLQRNERIQWPHDDEIGLLVKEYNNMVNKVEENAALLARSERETAWREMARQVAHEIKNPLTPMKLNIQYLLQAIKNDAPNIKELTRRVSESVIEQIENLSYIASEFSNFARMPEAKPEILDIRELLTVATGLYRNEATLSVRLELPDEPAHIYADHSQMLRVLTNLLENAKQAIPEERHGLIDVRLTRADECLTIAIADNGKGIPEDIAQRIFQPYFTTKSSGTGLGLAMTRKIIEFWKGSIWFDSTEDKGTTFFIKLPESGSSDHAPAE